MLIISDKNFSQRQPGTVLNAFAGREITFYRCNLINVYIDPLWIVTRCNTAQIPRCYWMHPEWDLPVEPENCDHVTQTDEIRIDGELVTTLYKREEVPL